ncbi:MAG: pentapeptide repeat-containing protein [Paludibacter sp.]|nr:pentapeptide repeat-containing protein [Paludibacter sp.]
MDKVYFEEKTVEKINYTEVPLTKGEYEYCNFINCDFSNSDLAEISFLECNFISCNLSMVKLMKTALKEINFKDCKMLGMQFDDCIKLQLSMIFENCNLSHSSFYRTKIKNTIFRNTQLHETDFTECELTGSVFDNCDLTRATFDNSILEKADFRTSNHYSIDPERNKIKKAKFSIMGISGLLDKYDIEID